MTITKKDFSRYIQNFDFRALFVDMGWHKDDVRESITIENEVYTLLSIAEQSGFRIFIAASANGMVPLYKTRRLVENKISQLYHDHLIIFVDGKKTEQVWLLVTRQLNQRVRFSEVSWKAGKSVELLYERTAGLVFEIEEEGNITIIDVTNRFSTFNRNNEKTEKKFYDRFKKEHDIFQDFITGIDGVNRERDLDWYASLMLNRLMFCYFIQKRRFLDNDMNYLSNKLKSCRTVHGKDKFYSFYRSFLKTLFHQGFASPNHNETLVKEIGRIPYLNGGLFDVHELELSYTDIDIKDDAFEKIFAFFDEYQWTLDTRDSAARDAKDARDEINPDVIGYIFEKYINDRAQMGAYYTKEDITEYISKNCVIPYLIDTIEKNYPHPFVKNGDVWDMVKKSEGAYIYAALKKGVDKKLPAEIEKGITNVAERGEWNKPASSDYALPTEIWREAVARRLRYAEIRQKISAGEIRHINDFITYNLNIRQFAQDIVYQTNDAALVKAYWDALTTMTILDPTCGSGAFLFAALNILEPLYDSCIERMRGFVEDEDRANGEDKGSFRNELREFREILADIQNPKHPNQSYYIYKTIILNNLYGVDIMREAVEIAKLRLFLKLVSTVEADYRHSNLGLEPLPDIDFNIRCGNTLVGFAGQKEIEDAFKGEMFDAPERLKTILASCATLADEFKHFAQVQLSEGAEGYSAKKVKNVIQEHLASLRAELNGYMALVYDINIQTDKKRYDDWLATHQPFHWFAEFYRIIALNGGFDVVIGNPPYVEYNGKGVGYRVLGYKTEKCGNLYAYVMERAYNIAKAKAHIGLIVPISLPSTPRMKDLRNMVTYNSSVCYTANFADRPGTIFSGVHQKVTIFIANKNNTGNMKLYTTNFLHWYSKENSNERTTLTNNFIFQHNNRANEDWQKIGSKLELDIFSKLDTNKSLILYINAKSTNIAVLNMRMMFWGKCFANPKPSGEYKSFSFVDTNKRNYFVSLLNSSLFFYFWETVSDCWHITNRELSEFKFNLNEIDNEQLSQLAIKLEDDLEKKKGYVGTVQTEYEYYHKKSKPIIDEIDRVLAKHYGFTDEELDFIINYDIKYRMGGELGGEGEGEDV